MRGCGPWLQEHRAAVCSLQTSQRSVKCSTGKHLKDLVCNADPTLRFVMSWQPWGSRVQGWLPNQLLLNRTGYGFGMKLVNGFNFQTLGFISSWEAPGLRSSRFVSTWCIIPTGSSGSAEDVFILLFFFLFPHFPRHERPSRLYIYTP